MGANVYTDEELLEYLRKADKLTEKYLTKKRYKEKKPEGYPASGTYAARFGGWTKAKGKAGLETRAFSYGKDYIKKAFMKAVEEFGEKITSVEYYIWSQKNDEPSLKTVQANFGSFNGIKDELGIEKNYRGGVQQEHNYFYSERFCRDCLYFKDCDIELEDCEYYEEEVFDE